METLTRKSPGSNPCEPVGSFCRIHQGSINGDGLCRIRRAWVTTMTLCAVCGNEEPKGIALTLNAELIRLKDQLQRPTVNAEYLATWLKVAKSAPGRDTICTDCADKLYAAVHDGQGNHAMVRLREDVEGAVRTFMILVRLQPSPAQQRQPARRPTPAITAAAVAVTRPLARTPISAPAPKPAPQPWQPASAVEVARAILSRRYGIERAGKRPRTDGGKGQETQCVVAANHGPCDNWGDWYDMHTLSMPSHDGSPPKAHYPFCGKCQAECEAAGIEFGPVLYRAVTGKDPAQARRSEAPRYDNVVPIVSARKTRDHDGRVIGHTGKTARKRHGQQAKIAAREEEASKAAAERAKAKPDKPSKEERDAAKRAAKGRR